MTIDNERVFAHFSGQKVFFPHFLAKRCQIRENNSVQNRKVDEKFGKDCFDIFCFKQYFSIPVYLPDIRQSSIIWFQCQSLYVFLSCVTFLIVTYWGSSKCLLVKRFLPKCILQRIQ